MVYPIIKVSEIGDVLDIGGRHWVCLENHSNKNKFILIKLPKKYSSDTKLGHIVGGPYKNAHKFKIIRKCKNIKTLLTLFGNS